MGADDPVKRVFGEYVALRRSGYAVDHTSTLIDEQVRALSQPEQERLLDLQRRWEAQVDRAAAIGESPDPDETVAKVPTSERTRAIRRIGRGLPSTAPIPDTVTCPDCGTVNHADEVYCTRCGLQLQASPGLPDAARMVRDETERLVAESTEKTYFGPEMRLVLRVQGSEDLIRMGVRTAELIIGRRAPEAVMIPDIDLTPFQATTKGVSRLHAAIRRQGNTLVLIDLDSLNHTYINGQRVYSQEVRVLRHGDELRFGQLRVQVSFEPA